MDINAIIDGILECKEENNMTFQQIADRSNVPKATVTRILRKETPNPSAKTLADIAVAVGYEMDPVHTAVLKDSTKDAYITYLHEALEAEKKYCKAQIAEQKALRHQIVAEKNRTIMFLSISLVLSISLLVVWLILEILHPAAGWIRWESEYHNTTSDSPIFMAVAEVLRDVGRVLERML